MNNDWRKNVIPELAASFDEIKRIRRDIHQHPELGYQETRTSALVADHLEGWGYHVTRGLGGTGVVGTLQLGPGSRSIGFRADMDGLPIVEASGRDHASRHEGVMHACGHDGHTATLLAAAKHLAASRNFSGTLHLIFQPAEEGGAGAQAMVDDGLFKIAPCDSIFAMHNYPTPTLAFGQMSIGMGAVMASADSLIVNVRGQGGHAASPQFTRDPIVAAAAMVQALQTIISRNASPFDNSAVSITSIHAGNNFNVIPGELEMKLSVRTLDESQRSLILARVHEIVQAQALCFGATATVETAAISYPVLINAEAPTRDAREVATRHFGEENLVVDHPAILAADDFAFMARQVPACYVNIGAGSGPALHNAAYDFNDDLLLVGGSFWVRLAETLLR